MVFDGIHKAEFVYNDPTLMIQAADDEKYVKIIRKSFRKTKRKMLYQDSLDY